MKSSATPRAIATTSWDDGAFEDLRLAELLAKYDTAACFYIPRSNPERPVLEPAKVREIAEQFEVGGHTLSHLRLTSLPFAAAQREIHDCKPWLEDVTGKAVRSFCYPGGMFTRAHAQEVGFAGFAGARTADWMRLEPGDDPFEIAPSLHLYRHSPFVHVAHCIRRRHLHGLYTYVSRFRGEHRPVRLAEKMLQHVIQHGGAFHMWGHSWEIAEHNLWGELEEILRMMASLRDVLPQVDNAAQADLVRAPEVSASPLGG